ncbi:MAG: tetratricopeptide repeat protein, partial [Flavobacteriales bacterium]|nr:tetratricopeptide repeat protein [Flavobacteriales bacterium]
RLKLIVPEDVENMAQCYQEIGNAYSGKGNYLSGLEYCNKAEALFRLSNDTGGIVTALQNIGVIYFSRRSYQEALNYYFEMLNMVEGTAYEDEAEDAYNNIATVYVELGDYELAIDYFEKALTQYAANDEEWGSAYALEGMAEVYIKLGKPIEAIEYLNRAIEIGNEYEDTYVLIYCYDQLGRAYALQGSPQAALAYQKRAMILAEELDLPENIQLIHQGLSQTYELMGKPAEALKHHKLYTRIGDSLLNAENSMQLNEMAAKYDTDKKQNEIEMLSKDNDIKNLTMNRQKIIIWSIGGGFLLVIGMAFFIYRGYKEKRQANTVLEQINAEVVEKNNKITESINYARRIQTAILPPKTLVNAHWPNSFIFYKPKDIVSGDFYWSAERGDYALIAAVDCTGHGVPGAFMSMIGNTLLTEIHNDQSITTPSAALKHLHAGLMNSLHQDEGDTSSTDGMDIAFCTLNRKTLELEYAGTHMPLYLVRDGKLQETKGDKLVIGDQRFGDDFTNHEVQLEKGDTFYIFSDGFADQFGGPDRKKFYYARFQELLLDINKESMEDQGPKLEKVIVDWIGDHEQIDDIMVIGVRI